MKAKLLLDTFEDDTLPPPDASLPAPKAPDAGSQDAKVKLSLNYPVENLIKGKGYYEWLDDLEEQIKLLPEAPTFEYDIGSCSFNLTGSQQAVDSGVEVVLKALKPLQYVKVWKDDVVVLNNFDKESADIENEDGPAPGGAPPSGAPAGNASSADVAGRTDGDARQPGALMGGSVNSLGAIPLPVFGVVRYVNRKEPEPKKKKGKRKKMIPRPKSRIGEEMKAQTLLELVEKATAKAEPHVTVYDRGEKAKGDRFTVAIHHPEKGHKVYTVNSDPYKAKKLDMFYHSTKNFKADKTWGQETMFTKLPDEVRHEVKQAKFAEGIEKDPEKK